MFDLSPKGKITFYQDIEALDTSESEREDEGYSESFRLLGRGQSRRASSRHSSLRSSPSGSSSDVYNHSDNKPQLLLQQSSHLFPSSILRFHSEPQRLSSLIPSDVTRDKTNPSHRPLVKKSASTSSLFPTEMAPSSSAIGKGKRQRPTGENRTAQVFRGLVFFFVPNDIRSGVRRLRIELAQKAGASWAQQWTPNITHIIADNDVKYTWLLKDLKLSEIPSGISIVKSEFIPDSLVQGLQDPVRQRYRVEGHVLPNKPAVVLGPSANSEKSLQLKPTKKVVGTGPDTQPTTVDSSADSTTAQTSQYNDELAKIIADAKAVAHLPLSDESGISDDDQIDSDVEEGPLRKAPRLDWQKSFQCMHKNERKSDSQNPNAHTIKVLEQMAKYYDNGNDQWRLLSYRKAIATLKNCDIFITTKEQAATLDKVGTSIAEKIEEIVTTNGLRKLEHKKLDPREIAIQIFLKVYGCGMPQAEKWCSKGYRTLQDLIEKANLTNNQRVGVEHYEDFNTRIPRDEVQAHGDFVKVALAELAPGYEATIMGSYRRGALDSGDIDMLITKPNTSAETVATVVFETLVPHLTRIGFLVAGLATSRSNDGSKWHGASLLPKHLLPAGSELPRWRRIDFLVVPESELGAALIYFTGNDIFNRSLRLLASKKKLRLNQHGLYKDVIRGPNRARLTDGTLVEGRSEQRIFEILGVPYRPPHHRVC